MLDIPRFIFIRPRGTWTPLKISNGLRFSTVYVYTQSTAAKQSTSKYLDLLEDPLNIRNNVIKIMHLCFVVNDEGKLPIKVANIQDMWHSPKFNDLAMEMYVFL